MGEACHDHEPKRARRVFSDCRPPAATTSTRCASDLWIIVNVENWDVLRAMPRAVLPPPMGARFSPIFLTGLGMNMECVSGSGDYSNA
jgi:hypothetical protein